MQMSRQQPADKTNIIDLGPDRYRTDDSTMTADCGDAAWISHLSSPSIPVSRGSAQVRGRWRSP